MANTVQATKRAKQSKQRELRNTSHRSAMRTAIKKVLNLLSSNKEEAKKAFALVVKLVDKQAARGLIHLSKASRIKSRLNKKLKIA